MAISDIAATTQSQPRKGTPCTVCTAIADLPDDEAQALVGLLADPAWRYQELSDRLADEGISLPAFSLSRHARGQCMARVKLRGA